MTGFLDPDAVLPYCPGCGHPRVLRGLDLAMAEADVPPHRYVFVTDIGCVGLADAFFPRTHTVHALHGRSTAIAAGIQMGTMDAEAPPLKPITLVGDGGATIGLLHLVHAAQIDVDVTVIVHNNLVYGMTGGQHSGLTPLGLKTTTTPGGNLVPPLDLEKVLGGAGCAFFARVHATGDDLTEVFTEAIRHPGFACVEVLELCTRFGVQLGGMSRKGLEELAEERGLTMGIVRQERPRAESPETEDDNPLADGVEAHPSWRRLDRTVRFLAIGRAGERVQSAAKLVAQAGCAAGLHATVRTDNPVTQGGGFSLAEVVMSPETIDYTGLIDPDLVVIAAPEGLGEVERRKILGSLGEGGVVVADESVALPADAAGTARVSDIRKRYGGKSAALGALVEAVHEAGWWAPEAWALVIERLPAKLQQDTRKVFEKAGVPLAGA